MRKGKEDIQRLLVYQGAFMISVKYDQIAFCFVDQRIVKLMTHDARVYYVRRSIKELEELLPEIEFFRINRSCIVSYSAIDRIELSDNHGLIVRTTLRTKRRFIVSGARIPEFKLWLGL